MRGYQDAVTRWHGEYPNAAHDAMNAETFGAFFDGHYTAQSFYWRQAVDFEGLWGRVLSSSYSPLAGHPSHEPLRGALRDLFERHSADGEVQIEYRTELVLGAWT
jgi:hypothetical protein